ncbi:MAG: efflux RND transporter periplasmic adaptor subunit [Betaproteobacteria bacterium]
MRGSTTQCRRAFVPAALLAGLLGGAGTGCVSGRASENAARAQAPVKARVVPVVSRTLQRDVDAVGSLFPFEEVTVSSEVEGRVEQVYVDVGDRVAAGRPLLRIVPVELSLNLDQEQAALRQIEARLAPPQGNAALKDESDAAEVRKAEADRTDAAQKFERAKELWAQGLIPRGTYDETEARYSSARAAYDMALQNVRTLQAQAAQRSASVALAEKKLRDTLVRSPFAGQVKERLVSPGQYVKVQTPVMVVVDTEPLRVRLKVPEKMAGWVAVGQRVTVRVEAYPDRTFLGKISRINPSVEPQTRAFELEALLDNQDGALKPGFFARATIASSHLDRALLVPREALRYLYGVYKVYAVDRGTLRETEVKLGARDGQEVEVVEGLKEGDRVAVPVPGEEPRDGAPLAAPGDAPEKAAR